MLLKRRVLLSPERQEPSPDVEDESKFKRRKPKGLSELFPNFPVQTIKYENDEIVGEMTIVWCSKNKDSRSGDCIPLDVCKRSVLRFDSKSRDCKRCFGLKKHQFFPKEFLEAKKESNIPQALMVISEREKRRVKDKMVEEPEEET
jgi:hypothetical protein